MRNIKYKIVKLDEINGQIIVRPEGYDLVAIDLPVDSDGLVPEGDELNNYIQGFLPYYHLDRKNQLINGIKNIDAINKLVEPEPEILVVEEQEPELTEDEKLAVFVEERNKRLLSSDWVELPSVRKLHTAEWAAAWDEYRQALRDMLQNPIDLNAPVYPIPPEE
jgi:hypothetical protein